MNIRQLDDRTEVYEREEHGKCCCGRSVTKVIGSSVTARADKVRYYYPGSTFPGCIFRCESCHNVIDETFEST
jgi:hypothetical protein